MGLIKSTDKSFNFSMVVLATASVNVGIATFSIAWGFATFFGALYVSHFINWMVEDLVDGLSQKPKVEE